LRRSNGAQNRYRYREEIQLNGEVTKEVDRYECSPLDQRADFRADGAQPKQCKNCSKYGKS
jgi:hypothetical protein